VASDSLKILGTSSGGDDYVVQLARDLAVCVPASSLSSPEFPLFWAGGLWDGEGSLAATVKRNGSMVLHASMSQNHREVLDKFRDAVGLGTVYGPYDRRPTQARPTVNPYYTWAVGGTGRVPAFFEIIRPYLSSVKVAQGEREIARYRAWKEAQ
jgi:hypothetical protein